ncbi:hypothetical protein EMPS_05489 [Entomortierella parvispora]|uniref:Ras-GEF domain-containing protein n=1 Tax=Entomortierella parvispora TaxID=205924 RepID=A0A9P3HAF7_9FUNG|nr:hypothetical protein EMPS_05489 [Entomortierella parvispora]
MDLSRYASLLQTAKAEHDASDLKNAYGSYLKAHSAIMRTLGTQIVFRDRDSIDVMPANYTQLNAHAQEILRRLNDIVETAKRDNTRVTRADTSSSSPLTGSSTPTKSSSLTTSSSTALASSTLISRPGMPPSAPSQRSTATTTTATVNKRTKKNIPMIPISPLTKQALLHSYSLSQVTARFEQAKQGSSPDGSPALSSGSRDLAHLRRLIEDVRIQRAKLDAVNIQIQSVATSTITSWDPETIARQLTIIDISLFKDVAIPRDLVRSDRRLAAARRCIDFENYVAHSLAHQLLQEWDASRQHHSSSNSPTATTHSSSKGAAQVPNAVAHLIRIAQILLHVYRNFNSFMAVMRALTSPEIKRMHRVWSGVPSKTKDTFKKLSTIYNDHGDLRGYRTTLLQKLSAFQDVGKDAVVAIPWMRFHQDEVKSIINSYLTGHETAGGSNEIVLSAPGARKLSAVATLLLHCRTNDSNLFDRPESDSKASQSAQTKNREPIAVEGIKTPLTPTWDLASLGHGDITLHHWILSRPYLNKQQLIDESLEIEPLFHGEELACYSRILDSDGEESILSAGEETGAAEEEENFEHVIAPEHDLDPLPETPTASQQDCPMLARSPVSETELNDIMNELLNDDDASDGNGLFGESGDNDSESDSGLASGQGFASQPRSSTRNQDVLQFLGINPDEASDSDDDGGEAFGALDGPSLNKGKGRAVEGGLDDDEISALLAQVKGLVRESSDHAEAAEASLNKSNFEEDEAQQVESKEESIISPDNHSSERRSFELFERELETKDPVDTQARNDMPGSDPLGLGIKRDVPSASSTPPPRSLFSLEAMRMQLQNLDNGPEIAPVVEDTKTEAVEKTSPDSAGSGSTGTEQTGDISPDHKVELPSSPPTATSTGNPFAPFMSAKSPVSSPETSISPLVKGRRRKLQVDRPKATSTDTIPHILSPPRPAVSFGFDSAESDMAEIEAKAKQSLASHAALSEAIHGASEVDHSKEDDPLSEPTQELEDTSAEKGEEAMASVVTLQELDKNILDSSLPSSKPLAEDLPSTLTTLTTPATKEAEDSMAFIQAAHIGTTTPAILLNTPNTDNKDPFTLGDNLFSSTIEKSDASTLSESHSTDHALDGAFLAEESSDQKGHDSKDLSKDTQSSTSLLDKDDQYHLDGHLSDQGPEDHLLAGEKSPPSDDGKTRANRQRRRKEGGLISLPTPSKTLLSMSSTGSLSNAFHASASSSATETTDANTSMTIAGQTKDGEASEPRSHSNEQHENSPHHVTARKMKTKTTTITTTTTTSTASEASAMTGCTDQSQIVARSERNDDIMTKTILSDVEVDVTASEVSSRLTKSPAEGDDAATMQEQRQLGEGAGPRGSSDQDDPSA